MTLNITSFINDKWSVIPVKDKRPLVQWQRYQTTKATQDEIAQWSQQFPGHDVGIVTGPISGIFVLDVDGEEGRKSLEKFAVPSTWTSRTKNGGIHYYFKWDDRLKDLPTTKVGVLQKVDVRGRNGYVVAYPWLNGLSPEDVDLAPIPDWLIKLLTTRPADIENRTGWISDALNNLEEGQRHATFAKLIGRLNRDGYAPGDIVTLLSPHAEACDLEVEELEKQVTKMCALYADQSVRPMTALSSEQLLDTASATIPWLVDGLLPREGVGILAGHPKIGKSWLTLSLAIAVSQGMPWLNKIETKQGRFVYVDEESSLDMLGVRFRKMMAHYGLKKVPGEFLIKQGFNFNNPNKVDDLRRTMDISQPRLMIFDSLNRMHKANENSASEMGAVFQTVSALAKDYGCFILFTDHLPHGSDRFRGTTDKEAFVDVGFLATKVGNTNLLVEHKYARHSQVPSFELAILDDGPDKTYVRWIG